MESFPCEKSCARMVKNFNAEIVQNDETIAIKNSENFLSTQDGETGKMIMKYIPKVRSTPRIGESETIFRNIESSRRIWVDNSTRNCKNWILPKPTFVCRIQGQNKEIMGPYNFSLPLNHRYILLTNNKFTWVFEQTSERDSFPNGSSTTLAQSPMHIFKEVILVSNEEHELFTSEKAYREDFINTDMVAGPCGEFNESKASIGQYHEKSDGYTCFPGYVSVELEDGSMKNMSKVIIGDKIRVGSNKYSEIFMFSHKHSDLVHSFLKISTANSEVILTSGNYLYVNGILLAANNVVVGDSIELASGDFEMVTNVTVERGKGLYNLQTVEGDIIVNNVRTSTYTISVQSVMVPRLLEPFRALYNQFGLALNILENGMESAAFMLQKGASVY